MKRFHMSQSVPGALANWSERDWRSAANWITRDDGTRFASGDEVRRAFIDLLSKGIEKIPFDGPCEGFDVKKGCPGHQL